MFVVEEFGPEGAVESLHLAGLFGDAGAVSRCLIPFSRQILSNSTSPLRVPWVPNRSVNCLPLSAVISSGTPNRSSASANARHSARDLAEVAALPCLRLALKVFGSPA